MTISINSNCLSELDKSFRTNIGAAGCACMIAVNDEVVSIEPVNTFIRKLRIRYLLNGFASGVFAIFVFWLVVSVSSGNISEENFQGYFEKQSNGPGNSSSFIVRQDVYEGIVLRMDRNLRISR